MPTEVDLQSSWEQQKKDENFTFSLSLLSIVCFIWGSFWKAKVVWSRENVNLWNSQRGVGASQLLLGCRVGVESAPSLLHFGDLYFGQNKPPPDQSWVWQLYLQDPISTKIQPVLLNSWHHKIGAGKGWNAKQKTYIPSADVPLFHNYLFISFPSIFPSIALYYISLLIGFGKYRWSNKKS